MKRIRILEGRTVIAIALLFFLFMVSSVDAEERQTRKIKKLSPVTQSAPKASQPVPTFQKSAAGSGITAASVKKMEALSPNVRSVQKMKAFSGASPELKELVSYFLTIDLMTSSDIVNLPSYRNFMKRIDSSGIVEIKTVLARTKNRDVKTALAMLLSAAGVNRETSPSAKEQIGKILKGISLTPYKPRDTCQFLALMGLTPLLDKTSFTEFVRKFFSFHERGSQYAVQQYIYEGMLQEMKSTIKAPPVVGPNKPSSAPRAR